MSIGSWRLDESLTGSKNVLLAGAGGGFDVCSAIPIYDHLKERGMNASLASLSFATLPRDPQFSVCKNCVKVTADFPIVGDYFPEYHLAAWFESKRSESVPVYCFPRTGVAPLRAAYRRLVEMLEIDTIVLVDGGMDSLMRGDESGLGTPEEDVASMAAVSGLGIEKTFLVSIGFGVDSYHGVCHAQFLEAVADLTRNGTFLGITSLLPQSEGAKSFCDAVDFANERTPGRESIVQNSVASAIEGNFGNFHRVRRSAVDRLWINPLMPVYWGFELRGVVERNLYIETILDTSSFTEITQGILKFRGNTEARGWDEIPV